MNKNAELRQSTTFSFSGDRAVRLAVNLRCPRCGTELKAAGDVGADRDDTVAERKSRCAKSGMRSPSRKMTE